jgi:chromosome segregation ATPase
MFIKKLELTNFKCHTNSLFELGKVNHFFGDNYSGKSSIGEAIVFCLYGVTKHGYKGFVKDYLQENKGYMKVDVVFEKDGQEHLIVRTMNPKGTTTVYLNHKQIKDKELSDLLGDYHSFIYCFFPEVFPEEDKSAARAYLIENLLAAKDEFELLEKEKSSILSQQKKVDSSKTFYEGQKSVLKRQIDSILEKQKNYTPVPHEIMDKKENLQEEITAICENLDNHQVEEHQLQTRMKVYQDKLKELGPLPYLQDQTCPTCKQSLPKSQAETLHFVHKVKLDEVKKEMELLEAELRTHRYQHSKIMDKKSILESTLAQLDKSFPFVPMVELPTSQIHELKNVESTLSELIQKKASLGEDLKKLKHQLGQLANTYQNQINQNLTHTKVELFKQLKNGELRPDFQITYHSRPYRVLSNSEKIRCMLEIIAVINQVKNSSYPIFLDNLESVTHLTQPTTQVLTATVKKGLPLTLKVKD